MKCTEKVYDKLEKAVQECTYVPEENWYPSMKDAEELAEDFFKKGVEPNDVAYLLWLVNFKKDLTEEQKKVRKYLYKVLYDSVEVE